MVPQFISAPSPTMARAGAGGNPCQGLWYAPDTKPKVAFIATHYDIDFSEHYLAEYLATRGYGFLGWNTRFRGMGSYFTLEQAVVDIGVVCAGSGRLPASTPSFSWGTPAGLP